MIIYNRHFLGLDFDVFDNMKHIDLTPEEKETLEEGYKNHPKFHVRKRFHSLSSRPQIIDTFL